MVGRQLAKVLTLYQPSFKLVKSRLFTSFCLFNVESKKKNSFTENQALSHILEKRRNEATLLMMSSDQNGLIPTFPLFSTAFVHINVKIAG